MKLPQKTSFGAEACEIPPNVVIWGIRRTGFPPEDSSLFYRASTGAYCLGAYDFWATDFAHGCPLTCSEEDLYRIL